MLITLSLTTTCSCGEPYCCPHHSWRSRVIAESNSSHRPADSHTPPLTAASNPSDPPTSAAPSDNAPMPSPPTPPCCRINHLLRSAPRSRTHCDAACTSDEYVAAGRISAISGSGHAAIWPGKLIQSFASLSLYAGKGTYTGAAACGEGTYTGCADFCGKRHSAHHRRRHRRAIHRPIFAMFFYC